MVTYVIGKAYDKYFVRRNIKKKLSDVDRQKKILFSLGRKKKKFASNKNSRRPPPQISNGASLIPDEKKMSGLRPYIGPLGLPNNLA